MNKYIRKLAKNGITTNPYMDAITSRTGNSFSGDPRGYKILGIKNDSIWIRYNGEVWSHSGNYVDVNDIIAKLSSPSAALEAENKKAQSK